MIRLARWTHASHPLKPGKALSCKEKTVQVFFARVVICKLSAREPVRMAKKRIKAAEAKLAVAGR
jgi:hypothetical protein